MATGPGLDRPLLTICPDYSPTSATPDGSYTMARTRKYYQDQMLEAANEQQQHSKMFHFGGDPPPEMLSVGGAARHYADSPRRMESLDSALSPVRQPHR